MVRPAEQIVNDLESIDAKADPELLPQEMGEVDSVQGKVANAAGIVVHNRPEQGVGRAEYNAFWEEQKRKWPGHFDHVKIG
ncbi:hypothetical protein COV82_04760 [Candidatus Peregrinibacteria bacterium CG11_big_fil_rev_8_21_14_0_20_46_8]|nr:MAG: hypothetical protein COV82_04760 [Candidatus Peregrinibacteria bacterium CG11_big_fil_rev_8_21_14_0_20_46_8]